MLFPAGMSGGTTQARNVLNPRAPSAADSVFGTCQGAGNLHLPQSATRPRGRARAAPLRARRPSIWPARRLPRARDAKVHVLVA